MNIQNEMDYDPTLRAVGDFVHELSPAQESILLDTLGAISLGIAVFDTDDRFVFANHAFSNMLPVLSRSLEVGHPIDREQILAQALSDERQYRHISDWMVAKRPTSLQIELPEMCRWLKFSRHRMKSGWTLSVKDISAEKRRERTLENSFESFRNIVLLNEIGILIVDRSGVVLLSNNRAQSVFGRAGRNLEGEYLGMPLVAGERTEIDIVLPSQNGFGVAEMSVSNTLWLGKDAYLVVLHDITDRKRNEERISRIAYHDPLTGLPNRRLFVDRLRHGLARAAREGDRLAVLFLDLDGFKSINDNYGHSAGDKLLCQATQRLHRCLRSMDTIARWGGDEFVILLEHIGDAQLAMETAERLRNTLRRPFGCPNPQSSITSSMGISLYPDHADSCESLLQCADVAMYAAKQGGKNRVVLYDRSLAPAQAPRAHRAEELHAALENHQFDLHYQPQIDVHTSRISGLEALLRWRHPNLGLLTPGVFITELEDAGLIEAVTAWSIGQVSNQLNVWVDMGCAVPTVAINLSDRCLDSTIVRDALEHSLAHAKFSADRLEFEITDDLLRNDPEVVCARIEQLGRLGVGVTLEGYGTHHSSLVALWQEPIRKLKIKSSVVEQGAHGESRGNVVATLVLLSQTLHFDIVATCVETEEQRSYLRSAGCSTIQGWLEAHPMPAPMITERLLADIAN